MQIEITETSIHLVVLFSLIVEEMQHISSREVNFLTNSTPLFCFRIAEIITVTPLYMNLTNLLNYTDNVGDNVYYKNVSWSPKSSQKGRHIFCFKAIDDYG